jgi:hypothetical protein
MVRKVFFIVFLISLLVGFFYFKPLFGEQYVEPNITDRLPEGDFLGRAYLLDVARESSAMLFYNKVPLRDFFSHEFLLAQGKSYGLDLQKPVYFFANVSGEWGAIVEVNDSSKVYPGVLRLKNKINLEDTVVGGQKVYVVKSERTFITYGKKWLFIYKGNQLPKMMYHVIYSKKGYITKAWRKFLAQRQFRDEKLVIYSNWKKIRERGVSMALFAHDSDSISFSLKTYIRSSKPLQVTRKGPGLSFSDKDVTDKLLNVHLDISELRKDKSDPLYQWMVALGRKVSFPTEAFLNAWEGDLSFRQGGVISVKESFVQSVLDDDFNVSEVRSTRHVQVPGFALLISTNNQQKELISQLFAKGILRKDGTKYRALVSPPLRIRTTPKHFYLYSADEAPATEMSAFNGGIWNHEGTKIGFSLDSLNSREAFGSIHIPVQRMIRRNRFF